MKYTAYALLALSAVLFAGCSSTKVQSSTLTDFDFSRVQTYEWVQAPKKILHESDTYLSENLQTALNDELAGRGWKQVQETDKADLEIVYYMKLQEHTEYAGPAGKGETQLTGGFTYSTSKGSWDYNDGQSDLSAYTIEVGTVTLLIYDAETGDKLWTGTLETRLNRTTPAEKHRKAMEKIARKIAARIP